MLSINSGPAVAWPTAAPVTVAPVSAVTAIAPAQRSSGDGNAGLDSGRRGQTQNGGAPAAAVADAPEAAPLLPRERTDGGREQASAETADAAAQAEQHERAQDKAEEKAAKLKLQEVLANVWKASAAVVDAVLGRDGANAKPTTQGDSPAQAAADHSLVVPAQLPHSEASPIGGAADLRDTQDVVAYDERGASSLAPLESGSLVNQRV